MAYPILAAQNTWYKGSTTKDTITQINIVDNYTATGNENESWNADVDDTGSIKCYITGTILTIAGNGSGKIALNADSSKAFYGDTEEARFTALTTFNGAELLDTSEVTTMNAMFTMCSKLTGINVSNWDTSKVTNMASTFNLCQPLASLDVSNWNTENVTNMKTMFQVCTSLTSLDLSKWDVSNVVYFANMFNNSKLESLNLSGWTNTLGNASLLYMFRDCSHLTHLDLSGWNVASKFCYQTFKNCSALEELNLSGLDVSVSNYMQEMFSGMSRLRKVILGSKFSFNGSGTLDEEYPDPAVLPSQSDADVPGADGKWYASDGTAYNPADIPNNVCATYFAVPDELTCDVLIKYGTLVQIADAIRAKSNSSIKYVPTEMAAAIIELAEQIVE